MTRNPVSVGLIYGVLLPLSLLVFLAFSGFFADTLRAMHR